MNIKSCPALINRNTYHKYQFTVNNFRSYRFVKSFAKWNHKHGNNKVKINNWTARSFRLRSFSCLFINKWRKSREGVILSHDLRRSRSTHFIQTSREVEPTYHVTFSEAYFLYSKFIFKFSYPQICAICFHLRERDVWKTHTKPLSSHSYFISSPSSRYIPPDTPPTVLGIGECMQTSGCTNNTVFLGLK